MLKSIFNYVNTKTLLIYDVNTFKVTNFILNESEFNSIKSRLDSSKSNWLEVETASIPKDVNLKIINNQMQVDSTIVDSEQTAGATRS